VIWFIWSVELHTFASWLMMRGASLRSVAELLGHQSMKMTMRYAHLSPAFLAAEVSLLDPPPEKPKTATSTKIPKFVQDFGSSGPPSPRLRRAPRCGGKNCVGSSGWTRTSNPPVNSRMLCH
jgi:hypothetical protein